jgi:hypothetical protein
MNTSAVKTDRASVEAMVQWLRDFGYLDHGRLLEALLAEREKADTQYALLLAASKQGEKAHEIRAKIIHELETKLAAAEAEREALRKGEYICKECGLRKNAQSEPATF